MKKKMLVVMIMLLAVFTLFACNGEEDPIETPLTAITFSGAENVTLDFEEEFNVLEGVTATGNNDVDYTDQITYSHVATTIITDDVLDTTVTGNHVIKYEVEVEGILAQKFRTITVKEPQAVEGQMLLNPDFSQGTAGWDGSAVYIADGAEMTLSTEEFDGNPALKAEVVAGSNVWTPRFGQMNVPFEQGKTYEVSFKAKSSVEKTINLQVGEILAAAPWWDDFKEGLTVHKTITTEWATYSYKFTMNEDNQRGGLLFEMGTIGGEAINATLWFDDIAIEESTPDVDETAPTFTGLVETRSVLVGNTFDPMAGVTAFDIVDGDVTEDIAVEIKDVNGDVVTTIDTSAEGTFTITYTVADTAGNEAEFVVTLEVVGMQFNETNLLVNGDFETALGDPAEWTTWHQDWNTAAVFTGGINETEGTFEMDITEPGDEGQPWTIQLVQMLPLLEEGVTYKASFDVKSSVARDIKFVITNEGLGYYEFALLPSIELTSEWQTVEVLFTAKITAENTKFEFDLGTTANFAASVISFDNIKLQEAILDDLIVNTTFADGWTLWYQNWGDMPTVTYDRTDGMFNVTTDKSGEANWAIQFNQTVTLEPSTTYVFSVDAMASVARDINIKIFTAGYVNYLEQLDLMLTTTMATYSYEFTTPAEGQMANLTLSFEMGLTANFAAGTVSLDNISLQEKDATAPVELIVNGDATTVPYFIYDNAGGGEGSMVLSADGNAVVTVTAIGEAYQPHMYQMLSGLKAGNYVLKVVVTSSVARDLRVNLVVPAWGYASILADGKEDFAVEVDVQKVVYVEFTVDNDITDEVKFEFDFGNLGDGLVSELGTFTIEEVLLYQDFN